MEMLPHPPPAHTFHPAPAAAAAAPLAPLRARLARHRLYGELYRLEHVRLFQEHHVFAVWDFMLLLKSLQRALTSVEHPWTPRGERSLRRFVNEIVLGEESDEDGRGGYASHFELYLEAMDEAGADARPARRLIELLEAGRDPRRALAECGAPRAAQEFCGVTLDALESGAPHVVAAAFTLGREEPIPELFLGLVRGLEERLPGRLARLRHYLERHIQLDGEHHAPLARRLLTTLCAADPQREAEAHHSAERALRARLALWDAILEAIRSRP